MLSPFFSWNTYIIPKIIIPQIILAITSPNALLWNFIVVTDIFKYISIYNMFSHFLTLSIFARKMATNKYSKNIPIHPKFQYPSNKDEKPVPAIEDLCA